MTRILMTADTVGGVWQYATDLADGLQAKGFEPPFDHAPKGPTAGPMSCSMSCRAGLVPKG